MSFNLLVAQSKSAHNILWGTGMRTPVVRDEKGRPVVDANGVEKRQPMKASPGDFIVAENEHARFGAITGTELDGYIKSLDMMIKDFCALTQTPPNYLLGQMANLSADALNAAEKSFRRKVSEYRRAFGESWERALRVGMAVAGEKERESWEHNEVLWRDYDDASLSQMADALTKLGSDEVAVPRRGLWEMIPGVTPNQLERWEDLRGEQDAMTQMDLNTGNYFDSNRRGGDGGSLVEGRWSDWGEG